MSQVTIKRIQFLSHQSKIASKIELLAYTSTNGILPPPEQLESLKFVRIGYLTLDSNERTNYKAVELKSVFINVPAYYLKICFMGYYNNKYNSFNQVSLMAINTIGEISNTKGPNVATEKASATEYAPLIEEGMMYDDITTSNLKKLYAAKEEAVAAENFDEAKKIKEIIEKLKVVGKQLLNLETRKKEAVGKEDYEEAKQLNIEIDKIRKSIMNNIDAEEGNYAAMPKQKESMDKAPEEMPISGVTDSPGVHKFIKGQNKKLESPKWEPKQQEEENEEEEKQIDHDNKVISTMENNGKEKQEYEEKEESKENVQAEQLSALNKKRASPFIDLVEMDLIQMLFSKVWTLREEALIKIEKEVTSKEYDGFISKDDTTVNIAALGIANELMGDKISQICLKSIDIVEAVLKNGDMSNKSIYSGVDKCATMIVDKLADTNQKVKERSIQILDQISESNEGVAIIINCICKGSKKISSMPIKSVQVRVEYLTQLIARSGSNPKGIESVVEFAIATVKHSNNTVRNASYALFEELYKRMGNTILGYLKDLRPAQMDILKEHFEKVGGTELVENEPEEEKVVAKQAQSKPKKMAKQKIPQKDDGMKCEYCGKIDSFTDEQMDMHLYKECPMLTICPGCMNVVEIIKLNEHLLSMCENKAQYTKCGTCWEAIETENMDAHEQEGCEQYNADAIRCPLCHVQLTPKAEEAWREHIMIKQCPNNERFPS